MWRQFTTAPAQKAEAQVGEHGHASPSVCSCFQFSNDVCAHSNTTIPAVSAAAAYDQMKQHQRICLLHDTPVVILFSV